METPIEVLNKELRRLEMLSSLTRHRDKREAKQFIPLYEKAIKILNEETVRAKHVCHICKQPTGTEDMICGECKKMK